MNDSDVTTQTLRNTLIEEGKAIVKWAENNNLLRLGKSITSFVNQEMVNSDFPSMFSAGESVLCKKPITAIGVNPNRNREKGGTIFLYTYPHLAKRDQKQLFDHYQGKSHLEFRVFKPFKSVPSTSSSYTPNRHNGRIPCGSSISLAVMRDAGTLGALVQKNNKLYGLSANHVTGCCSNALPGSPILFPGILDVRPGIEDPVTIGHHYLGLSMTPGNPQGVENTSKNFDAAIFSLRDPKYMTSFQGSFYDTPDLVETSDNLEDMDVEKVGRTTGHTKGFIESLILGYQPLNYKLRCFVSATESIPFEGIVYYKPTYLVRSEPEQGYFAQEGDSGAIVVSCQTSNETRKAIGLIIGGEGDGALIQPLDPILKAFDATLVSGYNI